MTAAAVTAPEAAGPAIAEVVEGGEPVEMRAAFSAALVELGAEHPRLVVLDGDLANATRVDAFADAFPDRFVEAGIGEQNMIGMAAGLAAAGMTPVATTFAAFAAYRDLDQVRVAVAQTGLHVVIVGAYAGLLAGRLGKSHVCVEDVALMRAIPGMTVLAPADAVEARAALRAAVAHDGPVYLRLLRGATPTLFPASHEVRVGSAVVVRDGTDVALLTTGAQLARTLDAARMLAASGIEPLVLHLPTIKPLDAEAVVWAATRTRAVVTAEDHSIVGGLGSAVAEVLAERRPTPLRRVGTRDTWIESGEDRDLLERFGLTPRHLVDAVTDVLATLSAPRSRHPAPPSTESH